ncbi:MAG: iron chelate uptake ABC transporter family permease subunit, partial [Candidatus Aminicenantes bacterium]|nr:iron chelate uptake ABC transporter family permease subunit [Candidatus Aminicenantes bacterium]
MKIKIILLYSLVFLAVALISPWIGPESIDVAKVLRFIQGDINPDGNIFWYQRVPRVLLGLLAGGGLALVGASFQVL